MGMRRERERAEESCDCHVDILLIVSDAISIKRKRIFSKQKSKL
jgi:hypothetical protein